MSQVTHCVLYIFFTSAVVTTHCFITHFMELCVTFCLKYAADYIWEISSFAVINVTRWSLWIRDVCEISFAVINVTSWSLWIWEMDPEDLNCRLCVLSVSLLCYCHFWTSVSTWPITALSPPRQPIASLHCCHMTWCRPLTHVIIQKLQCADVSTYSIQYTQTHFIQLYMVLLHWI